LIVCAVGADEVLSLEGNVRGDRAVKQGRPAPMTMPTVERAYALARSGQYRDFNLLKDRLKADGCRAVDALLAARSIRGHLEAICAASFKPDQTE
jgi:hypothetical protein